MPWQLSAGRCGGSALARALASARAPLAGALAPLGGRAPGPGSDADASAGGLRLWCHGEAAPAASCGACPDAAASAAGRARSAGRGAPGGDGWGAVGLGAASSPASLSCAPHGGHVPTPPTPMTRRACLQGRMQLALRLSFGVGGPGATAAEHSGACPPPVLRMPSSRPVHAPLLAAGARPGTTVGRHARPAAGHVRPRPAPVQAGRAAGASHPPAAPAPPAGAGGRSAWWRPRLPPHAPGLRRGPGSVQGGSGEQCNIDDGVQQECASGQAVNRQLC